MTTGNVESLYNEIEISDEWYPRIIGPSSREPMPVPYLEGPPPAIPIDVGRQLFVDDFLIEKTTLKQKFHEAEKCEHNPILKPETKWEQTGRFSPGHFSRLVGNIPAPAASAACPFDDGVFYDPKDKLFKMWYMMGFIAETGLAYSQDGIHWERPDFDVIEGSNIVLPYDPNSRRDSFSPWLDHHTANPAERFKAYLYTREKVGERIQAANWLYTSPDGIHWDRRAGNSLKCGDTTSLFYNPFRKKWALSIKVSVKGRGRCRAYLENSDFLRLGEADPKTLVFWVGADRLDLPDPEIGNPTQLYALAVAAYESIMLGVFTIHYGPENDVCSKGSFPKLTQLKLSYSRDGYHWARGDREVFISASKKDGDWDRAYLRAAGGGCLVVGDRLFFYYCGFSGISPKNERNMWTGGSTHVAFLRRDGFASMDAGEESGYLTTRPVTFKGKYIFVNVNAPEGELKVEVLDCNDQVIEPFSMKNCIPITADKTLLPVTWKGVRDLFAVSGKLVKFRFKLTNGSLYAFWVSPDRSGASYGYVGAGGPGFSGPLDTVGIQAYRRPF